MFHYHRLGEHVFIPFSVSALNFGLVTIDLKDFKVVCNLASPK